MRLAKTTALKRRRGMSFIEVVTSLVIISMLGVAVIGMAAILKKNTADTSAYTQMKVEAVDILDAIQADIEAGFEVDSLSYIDKIDQETYSLLNSGVVVTSVGEAFGKPLYYVTIELTRKTGHQHIKTEAFMRPGCTAHVM